MKTIITTLILSLFALHATTAQDPFTFDVEDFDFGQVCENTGLVSHDFIFTNTGKEPIIILMVKPSCGCTTPDWTKEEIAPGEKGTITAAYNPKYRPGTFRKSLTVSLQVGGKDKQQRLYFKGTVIDCSKPEKAPEPEAAPNIVSAKPAPFTKHFGYNEKMITGQETEFIKMISEIKKYVSTHGAITLQIESSASHVPTRSFSNNQVLAAQRAEEAKGIILSALDRKGIDQGKVRFIEHKSIVQGPDYQNDAQERMDEYRKYQYIKIESL